MKIKMRIVLISLLLLVWLTQFFVKGFVLAFIGWLSFIFAIVIIVVYLEVNPSMTLQEFIYEDIDEPTI